MAVNVNCNFATMKKCTRNDIVAWVNKTLQGNIERVEDLCTGSEYCQLMQILFPKSICMKKVRTKPKLEREFVQNFKLLQNALDKLKIDKFFSIEKIVKGKLQHNLDFAQWFMMFYNSNNDRFPNPGVEPDSENLNPEANFSDPDEKAEKADKKSFVSRISTTSIPKHTLLDAVQDNFFPESLQMKLPSYKRDGNVGLHDVMLISDEKDMHCQKGLILESLTDKSESQSHGICITRPVESKHEFLSHRALSVTSSDDEDKLKVQSQDSFIVSTEEDGSEQKFPDNMFSLSLSSENLTPESQENYSAFSSAEILRPDSQNSSMTVLSEELRWQSQEDAHELLLEDESEERLQISSSESLAENDQEGSGDGIFSDLTHKGRKPRRCCQQNSYDSTYEAKQHLQASSLENNINKTKPQSLKNLAEIALDSDQCQVPLVRPTLDEDETFIMSKDVAQMQNLQYLNATSAEPKALLDKNKNLLPNVFDGQSQKNVVVKVLENKPDIESEASLDDSILKSANAWFEMQPEKIHESHPQRSRLVSPKNSKDQLCQGLTVATKASEDPAAKGNLSAEYDEQFQKGMIKDRSYLTSEKNGLFENTFRLQESLVKSNKSKMNSLENKVVKMSEDSFSLTMEDEFKESNENQVTMSSDSQVSPKYPNNVMTTSSKNELALQIAENDLEFVEDQEYLLMMQDDNTHSRIPQFQQHVYMTLEVEPASSGIKSSSADNFECEFQEYQFDLKSQEIFVVISSDEEHKSPCNEISPVTDKLRDYSSGITTGLPQEEQVSSLRKLSPTSSNEKTGSELEESLVMTPLNGWNFQIRDGDDIIAKTCTSPLSVSNIGVTKQVSGSLYSKYCDQNDLTAISKRKSEDNLTPSTDDPIIDLVEDLAIKSSENEPEPMLPTKEASLIVPFVECESNLLAQEGLIIMPSANFIDSECHKCLVLSTTDENPVWSKEELEIKATQKLPQQNRFPAEENWPQTLSDKKGDFQSTKGSAAVTPGSHPESCVQFILQGAVGHRLRPPQESASSKLMEDDQNLFRDITKQNSEKLKTKSLQEREDVLEPFQEIKVQVPIISNKYDCSQQMETDNLKRMENKTEYQKIERPKCKQDKSKPSGRTKAKCQQNISSVETSDSKGEPSQRKIIDLKGGEKLSKAVKVGTAGCESKPYQDAGALLPNNKPEPQNTFLSVFAKSNTEFHCGAASQTAKKVKSPKILLTPPKEPLSSSLTTYPAEKLTDNVEVPVEAKTNKVKIPGEELGYSGETGLRQLIEEAVIGTAMAEKSASLQETDERECIAKDTKGSVKILPGNQFKSYQEIVIRDPIEVAKAVKVKPESFQEIAATKPADAEDVVVKGKTAEFKTVISGPIDDVKIGVKKPKSSQKIMITEPVEDAVLETKKRVPSDIAESCCEAMNPDLEDHNDKPELPRKPRATEEFLADLGMSSNEKSNIEFLDDDSLLKTPKVHKPISFCASRTVEEPRSYQNITLNGSTNDKINPNPNYFIEDPSVEIKSCGDGSFNESKTNKIKEYYKMMLKDANNPHQNLMFSESGKNESTCEEVLCNSDESKPSSYAVVFNDLGETNPKHYQLFPNDPEEEIKYQNITYCSLGKYKSGSYQNGMSKTSEVQKLESVQEAMFKDSDKPKFYQKLTTRESVENNPRLYQNSRSIDSVDYRPKHCQGPKSSRDFLISDSSTESEKLISSEPDTFQEIQIKKTVACRTIPFFEESTGNISENKAKAQQVSLVEFLEDKNEINEATNIAESDGKIPGESVPKSVKREILVEHKTESQGAKISSAQNVQSKGTERNNEMPVKVSVTKSSVADVTNIAELPNSTKTTVGNQFKPYQRMLTTKPLAESSKNIQEHTFMESVRNKPKYFQDVLIKEPAVNKPISQTIPLAETDDQIRSFMNKSKFMKQMYKKHSVIRKTLPFSNESVKDISEDEIKSWQASFAHTLEDESEFKQDKQTTNSVENYNKPEIVEDEFSASRQKSLKLMVPEPIQKISAESDTLKQESSQLISNKFEVSAIIPESAKKTQTVFSESGLASLEEDKATEAGSDYGFSDMFGITELAEKEPENPKCFIDKPAISHHKLQWDLSVEPPKHETEDHQEEILVKADKSSENASVFSGEKTEHLEGSSECSQISQLEVISSYTQTMCSDVDMVFSVSKTIQTPDLMDSACQTVSAETLLFSPQEKFQEYMDEAQKLNNQLNFTHEILNVERQFIFNKLRNIELICKDCKNTSNPLWKTITNILYAPTDLHFKEY